MPLIFGRVSDAVGFFFFFGEEKSALSNPTLLQNTGSFVIHGLRVVSLCNSCCLLHFLLQKQISRPNLFSSTFHCRSMSFHRGEKKKNFHSVNRREKTKHAVLISCIYYTRVQQTTTSAHTFLARFPETPMVFCVRAYLFLGFTHRESRAEVHLIKPTPGSIIIQIDCNHHTDSKRSILPARRGFLFSFSF